MKSETMVNINSPAKILAFIKQKTDEILGEDKDNNACFSEKPRVDIEAVAGEIGLVIQRVPPEEIDFEHARIKDKTILVNETDTPEEQRFSIAHEIYHFYTDENAARSTVCLKSDIWKNEGINIDFIAAKNALNAVVNQINEFLSNIIGKPVSKKTGKNIYEKIGISVYEMMAKLSSFNDPSRFIDEMINNINQIINKAINEEIADYFAANLIVPTERFILWEDRPDEEIACAFEVPVGCITKRRNEEIENEVAFLTPKNLSSGGKVNSHAPLLLDELKHLLVGHGKNDN